MSPCDREKYSFRLNGQTVSTAIVMVQQKILWWALLPLLTRTLSGLIGTGALEEKRGRQAEEACTHFCREKSELVRERGQDSSARA